MKWKPSLILWKHSASVISQLNRSSDTHIKGTEEKFKSSEQDEQKAYQDYLKNKLQQLYNNLYKILKKIVHAITLTSYISNRNTRRKTNSS